MKGNSVFQLLIGEIILLLSGLGRRVVSEYNACGLIAVLASAAAARNPGNTRRLSRSWRDSADLARNQLPGGGTRVLAGIGLDHLFPIFPYAVRPSRKKIVPPSD